MDRSAWKRVAVVAAVVVFIAGMIGCAINGWHAPSLVYLIPLFAVAVVFGMGVNLLRARWLGPSPLQADDAILEVTSTTHVNHALAAVIGVITSMISGIGLGMAMSGWTDLFLASIVGSLYMATWPLQVIAAHAFVSGRLSIGLDAIRIDGHVVPFHAIRGLEVDAARGTLIVQTPDGVLRHACTSLGMARDLQERIASRLASNVSAEAAPRVAREGRTLDAWRNELLSPSYRSREVTSEEATRILTSAAATPDERVGAALILAGRAEGEARDQDRARIRVAAAACVDRKLRVALEHVASDELEEAMLEGLDGKAKARSPVS